MALVNRAIMAVAALAILLSAEPPHAQGKPASDPCRLAVKAVKKAPKQARLEMTCAFSGANYFLSDISILSRHLLSPIGLPVVEPLTPEERFTCAETVGEVGAPKLPRISCSGRLSPALHKVSLLVRSPTAVCKRPAMQVEARWVYTLDCGTGACPAIGPTIASSGNRPVKGCS